MLKIKKHFSVKGIMMNMFFANLPLFMELAKLKSYTKAAHALGIGVSTLSRRIRQMESEMGVALFTRNTRSVSLTESGQEFFQHCEAVVAEANNAKEAVVGHMVRPSGVVRVAMLSQIYHFFLADTLVRFAELWPDIHLHITLSDRAVDLVMEPYDLDIRVGPLKDSTLRARKIYTVKLAVYGSPKLLERHDAPQSPQDLKRLPCITMTQGGNPWHLTNGKRKEEVFIDPVHIANSVNILHDFTLAGLGVTMMLPPEAAPHEQSGALARLLPEWNGSSFDMYIILPSGQAPRRVRVFVDYLCEFFAGLQKRLDG